MVEEKVREGYKRTEVGVIPVDWEVEKLGNIVEIRSGESPSKFEIKKSGIPYFKVEQLNNSTKYQKNTNYFIDAFNPIKSGSIIFPKRGAAILTNKLRILSQDSFMDTNLMTLSILTNDHTEYIYYWLYNFGLWRLADTTSVPQINNKHIIPFLIPLPPLKEQKAIADVLSDTDDLITTLQKLIDKKEKIKKGAMKKLLTGKERLPGFNGEWEEEELNSIADIYQPKTISQSKMKDTGYTVYGANGKIGYYDKYNHVLEQIILTCRGSTCGTINFTDKKSWITGNAMVINIDNNKNIHKKFFYFKLLSTSFEDLITGTGQPQITRQAFRGFKIYYPKKIEEQKAIAQILSDMDAEIEALNKKLEKYKKIKQGMMEELLTGRVRLV